MDVTTRRNPTNKIPVHVNIIGAGFAGIECALQLAAQDVRVHVFNMERGFYHCQEEDCEWSCVGPDASVQSLLQSEIEALDSSFTADSTVLRTVGTVGCPAKKLLEVGLAKVKNHPNIDYFNMCIHELNPKEINIIATGPQTEGKLYDYFISRFGSMRCFNFLPVYPRIADIDMNQIYRRKDDENFYLPLSYDAYIHFCNQFMTIIREYEGIPTGSPQSSVCAENLVLKGKDALKNACFLPIFLEGLSEKPYALITLRPKEGGYEVLNFTSRLPIAAQEKVLKSLPGFENIKLLHGGTAKPFCYMNTPYLLNTFGQCEKDENLFFAGSIVGLCGHREAMASGLYVARNVFAYLRGKNLVELPKETCIGNLMRKIVLQSPLKFTPIHATCDIIHISADADALQKQKDVSRQALTVYKEKCHGKFI